LRAKNCSQRSCFASLPNIPADDVPEGASEEDNVEIANGAIAQFDF